MNTGSTTPNMSPGLVRYLNLVDELLWRRAILGELADDEEEALAIALNDCRPGMSEDEQKCLGRLIDERRAAAAAPEDLGLVDTEPGATLRKAG